MGSEDLFRKRKKLSRNKPKREPYAKVLIVTEGQTELLYFRDLIQHYKINSANAIIVQSSGTSPKNILAEAKQKYEKSELEGDPFNRIYCVFDKETNSTHYQATRQAIENIKRPKNTYYAIYSVPCFEYWLRLHFGYTTNPYSAIRNLSIGDTVKKELRKFIPDYHETKPGIFDLLFDKLETAKINSENVLKAAQQVATDNPSTNVHELVEYLQNIKTQRF